MQTRVVLPRRFRPMVVVANLAVVAAAAAATATTTVAGPAGWVKDASRAPFPAQAARGTLLGKPFLVKAAQLARTGSMTMGEVKMDTYSLDL